MQASLPCGSSDGSNVALVGSNIALDGPKVTIAGSSCAHDGSKVTIDGSTRTLLRALRAIMASLGSPLHKACAFVHSGRHEWLSLGDSSDGRSEGCFDVILEAAQNPFKTPTNHRISTLVEIRNARVPWACQQGQFAQNRSKCQSSTSGSRPKKWGFRFFGILKPQLFRPFSNLKPQLFSARILKPQLVSPLSGVVSSG